jgi:hypothetical protein
LVTDGRELPLLVQGRSDIFVIYVPVDSLALGAPVFIIWFVVHDAVNGTTQGAALPAFVYHHRLLADQAPHLALVDACSPVDTNSVSERPHYVIFSDMVRHAIASPV